MNERIKELADEAAKFSAIMALPTGESGDELFVEKFAELIVEECIVIMYREIDEEESKEKNRTISDMMDLLEKHFGVEE